MMGTQKSEAQVF